MKKKRSHFLLIFILFLFPVSYFSFKQYIGFDTLSAIFFVLVIVYLIARNWKILDFQPFVKIGKVPIIYFVLWRTKFGVKFIDKISSKYREIVKLIGYCFVGFGFLGLIAVSIYFVNFLYRLFVVPQVATKEVALVLPLTTIPGAGYLSFWHFIITLFITILIHEFAHGIVARAHDIKVQNSGLGIGGIIAPIFPLAFVEPDEKKFQKQKDIIQYSVLSAGPIVNIVLALLVLLFLSFAVAPIQAAVTHPVGVSFMSSMENYSAAEVGLQPGMIITGVNGESVVDYDSFAKQLDNPKPGQSFDLQIENGTSYLITLKPSPDDPNKGYIGILGVSTVRKYNKGLEWLEGPFGWLKMLFYWLLIINFGIGLINLLPLYITDGGRMLKVALDKILGDAKKASKIWAIISGIFLFTLLFSMILKYIILPLLLAMGI